MNICVTLNNKYAKFLFVMLKSLIDTNGEGHNIFILYESIDNIIINKLEEFINNYHCRIVWIKENSKKYMNFPMKNNWSYETYFILRIHELLPDEIDRVLYLDVDTIICEKLENLYNINFEDCYIAARKVVPEDNNCTNEYVAGKTFINSGVVMMNLRKMRSEICFRDYLNAAKQMKYNFYMDEALLSYVMLGKIRFISYKYNYWISNSEHESPCIIHYICPEHPYKPWDLFFLDNELNKLDGLINNKKFMVNREINDLFKIWWKYARETPYYEELKKDLDNKKEWFIRCLYEYIIKNG